MKICFLTHNLDSGNGWGRYASELIRGVKKSGHEVVMLKEVGDQFEGVTVIKRGIGLFLTIPKIRNYFKKCDLIHALDGYPYGIIAALASIGLGKKLIITGQGTNAISAFSNHRWSWLMGWAYKKANVVTAISNYTKAEILKHVQIPNLIVINHGIDYDRFYRPRGEEGDFILSVGALKQRKGYHVSVPAFAEAKKKLPNLRYIIVGDQSMASYFDKLKNIADEYDVKESLEFKTGISDGELGYLYSTARLFILTSINDGNNFEGFGLVFLEAAAAGLPVIGTSGNGIEDAVNSGRNGILVSQNNVEEASSAIEKIAGDEKLRSDMSEESYKWSKEHDLIKTVNNYLTIYQETLNKTS